MARRSMKQFRKKLQEQVDAAQMECETLQTRLSATIQKRDALKALLDEPELQVAAKVPRPRKVTVTA